MKKTRILSALLVLTTLSTCIISGTFAKYVTTANATDTARVAKFGVTVEATGTLFDTGYVKTTDNNPGTANLTVQSSNTEKLVAPGTQNDTGMTFKITGKPEVAVKLEVKLTNAAGEAFVGTKDDVFLKSNAALPDMTTQDPEDTFNNAADYYPIVYTLKKGSAEVATGKLSEIADYMNGTEMNPAAAIPANTDLTATYGTYTLTWKYDFDASGAGTYDKQDTLLGDLAAGTTLAPTVALTAGTDYNLKADPKISITVTQVD